MSDINYDINHYNIKELVEILGLKLPANKDQIIKSINLNKSKTNNKQLIEFFNNIQKALVGYLARNNTDVIEPNAGYGLHNIYDLKKGYDKSSVGDRMNNNVTVVNPDRSVQIRNYLNDPTDKVRQGFMNPLLRHTQTRLLTIDSHYRQNSIYKKTVTQSVDAYGNCVTDICNNSFELPNGSTDFLINFNEPLRDVIALNILAFEIPISWYIFSDAYGTNQMEIRQPSGTGAWTDIVLDEGNYRVVNATLPTDLLDARLQTAINATALAGFSVVYNPINYKITIKNTTATAFDMRFYDDDIAINDPCLEQNNGTKNSNLGWVLGFRKPLYEGETSYTGEAAVNLLFTRYLYISLDDFNKNYTNRSHINVFDFEKSIIPKAPKYYNKNIYCTDTSGNDVYIQDPNNTLTKAQKYSIQQILTDKKNTSKQPEVTYNQMGSSVIARITNSYSSDIGSLQEELSWLEGNIQTPIKREYFGPTTIRKVRVKLLNDKGNIINLNHQDWSFSIEVTQLYQY
jgi:hypothetical protein